MLSASLTHCNDVCYFLSILIFSFSFRQYRPCDHPTIRPTKYCAKEQSKKKQNAQKCTHTRTHFSLCFPAPAFMRKVYGQTLPDKKNINAPHSRKFSTIFSYCSIIIRSHTAPGQKCVQWNPQFSGAIILSWNTACICPKYSCWISSVDCPVGGFPMAAK